MGNTGKPAPLRYPADLINSTAHCPHAVQNGEGKWVEQTKNSDTCDTCVGNYLGVGNVRRLCDGTPVDGPPWSEHCINARQTDNGWSSADSCPTGCPRKYCSESDRLMHLCDGTLVGDPRLGYHDVAEFYEDDYQLPSISRDIPTPTEFVPYIEASLQAVLARLTFAGEEYGEEVLFLLDQMGAVSQCFTKASRLLWSFKKGQSPEKRKDGWMDLAGYAILEMARYAYTNGNNPEDVDGLFDRSGQK